MTNDDDLDESTFPAWRDALAAHVAEPVTPRSYPGYPRVALPAAKPGRFGRFRGSSMTLERALASRRSVRALGDAPVALADLGRIARLAHGITGTDARGPTPSAGGLQALELYAASWAPRGDLVAGWYHYDRAAHALVRIVDAATREAIAEVVPSLATIPGGSLVWIVVGDRARVAARYTTRADRFLVLEAGHLLQSLALAATAGALVSVPLGGFFERAIARTLQLPRTDRVLAVAVLGHG